MSVIVTRFNNYIGPS